MGAVCLTLGASRSQPNFGTRVGTGRRELWAKSAP